MLRQHTTRIHSIDGDNMDIGSSLWMRDIDSISHQIRESLSLEGMVVTQRATELQSEARKVYFNTGITITARTTYQDLIPRSVQSPTSRLLESLEGCARRIHIIVILM